MDWERFSKLLVIRVIIVYEKHVIYKQQINYIIIVYVDWSNLTSLLCTILQWSITV